MFGTSIHDPPDGVLPRSTAERILPRPRTAVITAGNVPLSRVGAPCASLVANTTADLHERTAVDWLRSELRHVHGWEPADARAAVRLVVGTSEGCAVHAWVERTGMEVPSAPESYALSAGADHVVLAARDGLGLLRGVTTLVQLLSIDGNGDLAVDCGEITDKPGLPLRILIGWVRCDPAPRSVVDLAFRWKYNRVYYGAWPGGGGGPPSAADRWLVQYARSLGIELMFQLSRLSFPQGFDADSPADTARVLASYEEAVGAGYRSFGILFDDQTLQSVDAELRLTLAIHRRLTELLGHEAELTFVPEVYWVPGELAGWPPQPERAEEFRAKHRAYLAAVGAALPPGIGVYIANNWNDFPAGYAEVQDAQFNALVRRSPIFFENQLTNDYRRAILLPFPVHNRPPEFAGVMGGYGLNLPMPYAAYRASIACCGALAWNAEGYDPSSAWGAALLAEFGSARAPAVLEALNGLNRLFVEWTRPHFPAASHYGSLLVKLRDGQLTAALVEGWQGRVADLKELFARAAQADGAGTDAIGLYLEEMERLGLDMAIMHDILATRTRLPSVPAASQGGVLAAYRARQAGRRRSVLAIQARRAPPFPGLRMLLVQQDGTDLLEGRAAADVPEGWWLTYFYIPLRDDLDAILRLGEQLLASSQQP
jgi:hypothetical protein